MNARDIYQLLMQTGFPQASRVTMTAIGLAESSGNPSALNANAATGDYSMGLFQINMLPSFLAERLPLFGITSRDQLYDPTTNAHAALVLFNRAGGSFGDWSTYRNGAYQRYLADAAQAQIDLGDVPGTSSPTDAVQAVPDPLTGWADPSAVGSTADTTTATPMTGTEIAILAAVGIAALVLLGRG